MCEGEVEVVAVRKASRRRHTFVQSDLSEAQGKV